MNYGLSELIIKDINGEVVERVPVEITDEFTDLGSGHKSYRVSKVRTYEPSKVSVWMDKIKLKGVKKEDATVISPEMNKGYDETEKLLSIAYKKELNRCKQLFEEGKMTEEEYSNKRSMLGLWG